MLQDEKFSGLIPVETEYQESVAFSFYFFPAHAETAHHPEPNYVCLYDSPLPLPARSVTKNTFKPLRDQPKQSKEPRAALHLLFGLG